MSKGTQLTLWHSARNYLTVRIGRITGLNHIKVHSEKNSEIPLKRSCGGDRYPRIQRFVPLAP